MAVAPPPALWQLAQVPGRTPTCVNGVSAPVPGWPPRTAGPPLARTTGRTAAAAAAAAANLLLVAPWQLMQSWLVLLP